MAYSPVYRSTFDSSKKFLVLPVLLLVGAALLAGCHAAVKDPKDPKFIVAESGNWQITRAELNEETASLLKKHHATPEQVGPEKMLEVESSVLKKMVLTKLLMARAATLQLGDEAKDEAAELENVKSRIPLGMDFDQQLKSVGLTLDDLKKEIHEKVVIEKVLKAEALKNDDPTDQEINDFYLQHKKEITTPLKVRASRILIQYDNKTTPEEKVAKKKAIDKAHARVLHGEDFSKVAMEVSEDRSSAPKGGDIDYFQIGENDPAFDKVAFATKQGELSPVFETSLGYQFLKVTDIKPASETPLADVRPKLVAYLRDQKMKEQSQAYIKKLLADSGVVYHVTMVEHPTQTIPVRQVGPNSAPPSAVPASSASAPPAAAPSTATPPTEASPTTAPAAAANSAPSK